jgi:hypothetical protein
MFWVDLGHFMMGAFTAFCLCELSHAKDVAKFVKYVEKLNGQKNDERKLRNPEE